MFAAFYFVIVLAIESSWELSYDELIKLWSLGALLVGLGALPAGWLGDKPTNNAPSDQSLINSSYESSHDDSIARTITK
jgi:hypothetical protein